MYDSKVRIKTSFSLLGLFAFLRVFVPSLVFLLFFDGREVLYNLLSLPIYLRATLFSVVAGLFLSLVFTDVAEGRPYNRRSRLNSFSYIALGCFYILLCEIFFGYGSLVLNIFIIFFASLYLALFSVDRRNCVTLTFSILFFVVSLIATILMIIA